MNPLVIVMAVVLAVALFSAMIAFLMPTKGPSAEVAMGRLENYLDQGGNTITVQGQPQVSMVDKVRQRLGQMEDDRNVEGEEDELTDILNKADLPIRKYEWYAIQVGVGLLIGAIILLRFFSGNLVFVFVFAIAAGVLVPMVGGRFFLNYRQKKRINKFNNQLGDVVIMLSNGMRAGYSFPQALSTVAASSKAPIGVELARAAREIQLGLPLEEVLGRLVDRNPSEDLDLLVAAVQLQRLVGGNLAEILDTIAGTIRERVRLKDKIRALTAQARISGIIIGLLPIFLALVLFFIAPTYFGPMTKQLAGQIMLGFALVIEIIGFVIIQKITDIRV